MWWQRDKHLAMNQEEMRRAAWQAGNTSSKMRFEYGGEQLRNGIDKWRTGNLSCGDTNHIQTHKHLLNNIFTCINGFGNSSMSNKVISRIWDVDLRQWFPLIVLWLQDPWKEDYGLLLIERITPITTESIPPALLPLCESTNDTLPPAVNIVFMVVRTLRLDAMQSEMMSVSVRTTDN
jgi:hypothetical protein